MQDTESPVPALLPQLSDSRSPALRSDPVLCDDPLAPSPITMSEAALAAAEVGLPKQIVEQHRSRGTVGKYLGQNDPAAATMMQVERDIALCDDMMQDCVAITKMEHVDPETRGYYAKTVSVFMREKRGLMNMKLKMISESSAPATDGKRKARGPLMKGPIHLHQHQHPKS